MVLTKWKEKIKLFSLEEKPFKLELLPKAAQDKSHFDMNKVVRSEVLKSLSFYSILDSFQISLRQVWPKLYDIKEYHYDYPFIDKKL